MVRRAPQNSSTCPWATLLVTMLRGSRLGQGKVVAEACVRPGWGLGPPQRPGREKAARGPWKLLQKEKTFGVTCQGRSRSSGRSLGGGGCRKTGGMPRPAWPGAFLPVLGRPVVAPPAASPGSVISSGPQAFVPGGRKDKSILSPL